MSRQSRIPPKELPLVEPERSILWGIAREYKRLTEPGTLAYPILSLHTPIINPYITSSVVPADRVLIGRSQLLNRMYAAITAENLQPMLIYGGPKVGKTSLMDRLNQQGMLAHLHMKRLVSHCQDGAHLLHYICERVAVLDGSTTPDIEEFQANALKILDQYFERVFLTNNKRLLILAFDGIEWLQRSREASTIFRKILSNLWALYQNDQSSSQKRFSCVFVGQLSP